MAQKGNCRIAGDAKVCDDIKKMLNNPYICGDANNVDFTKLYFGVKC